MFNIRNYKFNNMNYYNNYRSCKSHISLCIYKYISIILLFLFFDIGYFNFLYADNIIISEDKNIVFDKDFNHDGKIVITLDAGHGGDEFGTQRNTSFDKNSDVLSEKDINLYIAKKVYEYIDKYYNECENKKYIIETYLTRDVDKKLSLKERGEIAGEHQSDIMLSLHFNSLGKYNNSPIAMGAEIWQSVVDMYKPVGLDKSIFSELNKNHFLQVVRGARERISGDSYWNYELNDTQAENNGNAADYYGVIRAGCKNRVPTIILEHSFMSNDNDFYNLLNDDYLDELSSRVARGIVNYYMG